MVELTLAHTGPVTVNGELGAGNTTTFKVVSAEQLPETMLSFTG
jgi:ABC-type uncharacterized transport system ATPase component